MVVRRALGLFEDGGWVRTLPLVLNSCVVLKKAINLSKATFLSTAKYGVIKSTLMSYYNDKLNVIYVPKTESSFKKQNAT